MEFKPLNKRVVIEPIQVPTTTASGIVLPAQEGKSTNRGRILAIAEDINNGSDLVGRVAVYGTYAGQSIDLEGKKILIMQYEDLLGLES